MRVLVLGGTRFVGRAVVESALQRGYEVAAVHRGISGPPPDGAESILLDRTDPEELTDGLAGRRWDVIVDTWPGPARIATMAAAVLAGRASAYGYVSSVEVYQHSDGPDGSRRLVYGDPLGREADYSQCKRGAERGVLFSFPDALLARASMIMGPRELDWSRLPWWLFRVARGGTVVAPGQPTDPVQYVDVRDFADWFLTALIDGRSGAVDVSNPPGHATMEQLLAACLTVTGSDADLVWVDDDLLTDAGLVPDVHLPCWQPKTDPTQCYPPADSLVAVMTGLRSRPIEDTVADTWAWMQHENLRAPHPGASTPGLSPRAERQILRLTGRS